MPYDAELPRRLDGSQNRLYVAMPLRGYKEGDGYESNYKKSSTVL